MKDSYGRRIDYLRISVTDRCNLRCHYCRPADGVKLMRRRDILSYEEITDFARVAAGCGFRKVRLTGGEPLVRRDFVWLVGQLAGIEGIEDLCMTTNGVLLAELAQPLARAGLQRVNVSLDAVAPERYARITRGGDVRQVLAGIEAARAAGLDPIKLNCVFEKSSDERDARDVAEYARSSGLEARFIRRMDLARGHFWPVEGGSGGRCEQCNRLRLTSDGHLRPCLLGDAFFDVRRLGYEEAIAQAVAQKPASGTRSASAVMHAIGG